MCFFQTRSEPFSLYFLILLLEMSHDESFGQGKRKDQHAKEVRPVGPTRQEVQNDASREVCILRTTIGDTENAAIMHTGYS